MSKKRATKQGQQYKKNRKTAAPQTEKKEGLSLASKVVITVFAVLMALGMMLPSLAGLVDKGRSSTPATIEEVDARFQKTAEPLEQKVAVNSEDMDSVLQLGQTYMNWGYNVLALSKVDAETLHANELFSKAMQMFDSYIAANPDAAGQVKVDRALCLLYSGETSNALSALQAIVDEDPSNATAWANLGLVYEITGSTESARDAYTHAIEADPNDEAGAKSYASQRILQLNTAGSNSQGLSGTLRDLSGTNI